MKPNAPAVYFLLSAFLRYARGMAFAFEELHVYQKTITFADGICTLTRDLPRGYFFLGDQLSRASLSIAANIAPPAQPISNRISAYPHDSRKIPKRESLELFGHRIPP